MRDGYKIVDMDCHMMEPEWLWERYIEDRYKSAAPKMGLAPESGRRTFLVEGEPFTREKGKYPMAAPAFFKAVAKAMQRFKRAKQAGFSAQSRLQDMDEQGVDVQILYPTFAGQMLGRQFQRPRTARRLLPRLQRLGGRLLRRPNSQAPASRGDPADAGRRRGDQGGEARGRDWAR